MTEQVIEKGALAWTAIVDKDGFTLGVAEYGTAGYSPVSNDRFPTYEAASAEAHRRNTEMGLSDDQAFRIIADTMRRQFAFEGRR